MPVWHGASSGILSARFFLEREIFSELFGKTKKPYGMARLHGRPLKQECAAPFFSTPNPARGQSVFEALCAHWLSCFAQEPSAQGISYHYDAKKVFGGSELSTGLTAIDLPDPARTRFYSFVRYAQDHLLRLYGPRPRSGKTDLPDLVFSCSQSGENSRADCPSSPTEGVVTING